MSTPDGMPSVEIIHMPRRRSPSVVLPEDLSQEELAPELPTSTRESRFLMAYNHPY